MNNWTNILVIAGLLAAIGPIVDRFLLKRQKGKLHDRLLHWWIAVGETPIPQFHRLVASWTIRAGHSALGTKWLNARALGVCVLLSFILTWTSMSFGWSLKADESFWHTLIYPKLGPGVDLMTGVKMVGSLLSINFVFDIATITVTYCVLRIVESSRLRWAFATPLIVADACFAFLLAGMCVGAAELGTAYLSGGNASFYSGGPWSLLYETYFKGTTNELQVVGYASTTLIPTAIYLLILLCLCISKPILAIGRVILLRFLERALDDDPTSIIVFTLTASVFSILILLGKAVHHFFL